MKTCYILKEPGSVDVVCDELKPIIRSLGKLPQYNSFRRMFQRVERVELGELVIEKALRIERKHKKHESNIKQN